jgi:LytS/YehU family sensor histidine kinase
LFCWAFLFLELVYDNSAKADKFIIKLSELLRLSLKGKQSQEVLLAEELEFLQIYLEIQFISN